MMTKGELLSLAGQIILRLAGNEQVMREEVADLAEGIFDLLDGRYCENPTCDKAGQEDEMVIRWEETGRKPIKWTFCSLECAKQSL